LTLILEIAAGIVLAVIVLFFGALCLASLAKASSGKKLLLAILVGVLIWAAYDEVFSNKKDISDSTATKLETRAHFAARYKKANPETASTPDEDLVRQILLDYPQWCTKVEGGCP
jgi:hypothetical protein